MFRKPIVWIAFVAVAAACAAYSYVGFPKAFPLVNLDLQMDRDTALSSARALAIEQGWGPEGFRQAAAFEVDGEVRSFVELEAGGRAAYIEMLGGDLYSPYRWQVRHFKPGETNETWVRFTPAGEAYGFREQFSEDEPGAALSADDAQRIAEDQATGTWGIRLDDYDQVERRQDVRPGGRVDHTLVYERPDVQIGEGRYRLRLVVAGDRLSELTHLVKVPEAFDRRFQEMRSFNNGIAIAASVLMGLVFMGGGALGLFYLLRERWVLWKQPLMWGGIVSTGMALLTLNQWPLAWVSYDTAVSETNFLLTRVAALVGQFVGLGLLYVVSFMAAETLTRRAFPNQIQLWKTWSSPVAGTPSMLGRTVSGYLLVFVDLAFLVVFYGFAFEKLGWWSPSEALLDPNILATPFPWLASIAISLQAGFWEECLFRAVPLAGAALLGKRYGGTRYWIVGALILQALVFGAGHASYPGHPSYARVVELFLPAVFWGVIYLFYGLIPVIVLHFAFDVLLISLPLWVSSAPGLWDDRVLVVLLTLVPLGVVLAARWRRGWWGAVDPASLNGAWKPPPEPPPPPAVVVGRQAGVAGMPRTVLWVLGGAGLAAWLVLAAPRGDAPPLGTTRAEALAAAEEALAARGWDPPDSFRPMATVQAAPGRTHRYIWQEGDPELYRDLLGRYLPEPRWFVRYATFEGDVVARAEEFGVWVDVEGRVTRTNHTLPEASQGADLDEDAARSLAHAAIREAYGLDPELLEEVKASPSKEENRTDWTFELVDRETLPLEDGEARVGVRIAGDEVADTFRYVHLPEEWERAERNRGVLASTVQISSLILMFGLLLAGAIIGLIRWSRGQFGLQVFLWLSLALVAIRTVVFLIFWPSAVAGFDTAQPYELQATIFLVIGPLVALVGSAVLATNAGFLDRWRPSPPPGGGSGPLLSGAALGLLVAGAAAAIGTFATQTAPRWPDYTSAGSAVPWVGAALGPVSAFATTATLLLLAFVAADRWTGGWTRRKGLVSAGLVVLGLVIAGVQSVESLPAWLAEGLLAGLGMWLAYVWVVRFDLRVVPVAVGSLAVLGTIRGGLAGAFPGALAGSLGAAVLIAAAALLWYRSLAAEVPVTQAARPEPSEA